MVMLYYEKKYLFNVGGNKMDRIGVGVIGLGHNGTAFCERHSKRTDCELVAVCDVDGDRLRTAAFNCLF